MKGNLRFLLPFLPVLIALPFVLVSGIREKDRELKRKELYSAIRNLDADAVARVQFHGSGVFGAGQITYRQDIESLVSALRLIELRGDYGSHSVQSWDMEIDLRNFEKIHLSVLLDNNTPGYVTLYDLNYGGSFKDKELLGWLKKRFQLKWQ